MFPNNKNFDRALKLTSPGGGKQRTKKFKKVSVRNLALRAFAAFTLISFVSQQCLFAQQSQQPTVQNDAGQLTPVITPDQYQAKTQQATQQNQSAFTPDQTPSLQNFVAADSPLQPVQPSRFVSGRQEIYPDYSAPSDSVMSLPAGPDVVLTGGSSNGSKLIRADEKGAVIDYDVTRSYSWSGITFKYDNYGTREIETADLSKMAALRFAILTDAGSLKMEVEDGSGLRDTIDLVNATGLAGVERIYEIRRDQLSAKLDWTRIRFINFVIDQQHTITGKLEGRLAVRAGGFDSPYRYPVAQADLTSYIFAPMPGNPHAEITGGSTGPTRVTSIDANTRLLAYNVTPSGSWSGVSYYYDNFSTSKIETYDFSKSPLMAAAVKGDATNVQLEVEDAKGKRANLLLENIKSLEETVYQIDLSKLASKIDISQVRFVNFVVSQNTVAADKRAGNLTVRFGQFTLDTTPPQVMMTSSALVNNPDYFLEYTVDGSARREPVTLVEGNNKFHRQFQDQAGNTTAVDFEVTLDTKAPAVMVTSSSITNKSNYVLSYTADGVLVTKAVTLAEGENTLNISARDAVGNETKTSFKVTLDTKAPVIAFSSPALTSQPDYSLTYLVDGNLVTKPVTLVEGDNVLAVVERDAAGNETKASFKVTLDTIAPEIIFSSAALTGNSKYTLSYTTDGKLVTQSATLVEGDNVLAVVERDAAGNETKTSFTVMLDTKAPMITFQSPALTNNPKYTLTYAVDGKQVAKPIALVEGDNILDVVERDVAGNETKMSLKVTLDTKAPEVIFTSPVITNNQAYTLTYTADGKQVTKSSGLVEGDNALDVVERDLAGNETKTSLKVTLDTIVPAVVATSVALTNNPDYTFSYTADGVQKTRLVTLTEGLNAIQISERDPAGNETKVDFKVTLDTKAPQIKVQSVNLTNNPAYELVYDADGVRKRQAVTLVEGDNALNIVEGDLAGNESRFTHHVTLDTIAPLVVATSAALTNKSDYTLTYTSDGVTKTQAATLVEGGNTLDIVERDPAGNETKLSYKVTLDTIAPEIKFSSVTLTNKPDYTLTYTADGVQKTRAVTLVEGDNVFDIVERDPAGNETKTSLKVTLDTKAPLVVFGSPILTNKQDYVLTYTVDGKPVNKSVTLTEGENVLDVVERDAAGNETKTSLKVTLDTKAPEITFLSPMLVNKPDYTLTYTSDGVQKTQAVTLVEGENVLDVVERDLAGNETKTSLKVTLDTIAPAVVATSIALTNNPDYTLSYTADGVQKTRSVTLTEGLNTLQISEQDPAGNQTNLNFDVTLDTIAPEIKFSSVTLTNKPDYMLTYTADGVTKTQAITLAEGDNVLDVVERDLAGNETKTSLKVTLDTIAPEIKFSSVALTNKPDYTLTYTADGVTKTQAVTLAEGDNILNVVERDLAGNEIKTSLKVILDTIAPEIIFSSPVLVNKPDYTLTYTADGVTKTQTVTLVEGENTFDVVERDLAGNETKAILKVTLDTIAPDVKFSSVTLTNKPDYTLAYTSDGVPVSKNLTLAEGDNVLDVVERDLAGNETKTSLKVTLDTIAPEIIFSSPVLVNKPDYTLTYTADGQQVTKPVTLVEGENLLNVVERDLAGNETKTALKVMLDTIAPEIIFSSPMLVNKPDYTLTYTADGQQVTKPVTLVEGDNVLDVVERDLAGNETKASLKVTLDTIPPQIAVQSINLTNNPAYQLTYATDGVTKNVPFTLVEGKNALSITERDLAGNETKTNFEVTLDTIPPDVQFSSSGLVTNPNYELVYQSDGITQRTSFSLLEGKNALTVTERDPAGNETTANFDVTLDTEPPAGSISVNRGETFTTSPNIDLDLTGADRTSGLDAMRFTLDGGKSWTNWEVFSATKSLTLPPGDGAHEIQYQLRDKAGLLSTVSASIILDTEVPSGSIFINNNDPFTVTPDVTLALTGEDVTSGVNEMRFSVDGGKSWTNWETFSASKSLTLPEGDGNHEIQYELKDKAGLTVTFANTIVLDTVPPSGSILINNGDTYSTSPDIALKLTGDDATSGIDQIRFSTDSGKSWTDWESNTSAKLISLEAGDGTREIQYQIIDKAGRLSTFSDEIILDTEAPTGTILINNGNPYTVTPDVTLTLRGEDKTSGVNEMRFSLDSGKTWTNWESFSAAKSLTLPEGDGRHEIQYELKDKAGLTRTATANIILDTVPPKLEIINSTYIQDASYAVIYLKDGVLATQSVTLTGGEKKVSLVDRDEAGNESRLEFPVYYASYLPSGTVTQYDSENEIGSILTPDGMEVRYLAGGEMQIFNQGMRVGSLDEEAVSKSLANGEYTFARSDEASANSTPLNKAGYEKDGFTFNLRDGKIFSIGSPASGGEAGSRLWNVEWDESGNLKNALRVFADGTGYYQTTDENNFTASYFKGEDGKLQTSLLQYQGARVDSYQYEYGKDYVGVLSEKEGIERRYDSEGVLRSIVNPDGLEYKMIYDGSILKTVNLKSQKLVNGTRYYENGKLAAGEQAMLSELLDARTALVTRLDAEGRTEYVLRADGSEVFYGNGKILKVVSSAGAAEQEYQYDGEGHITRIILDKEREQITKIMAGEREWIDKRRGELLQTLSDQDAEVIRKVDEEVARQVAAINSQISSLESQRYYYVTKTSGMWWWKKTWTERVEVPGVGSAINNLVSQRAQVEAEGVRVKEEARLKSEDSRNQILAESERLIAALPDKEKEFRSALAFEETAPVIAETYRELLGRDPTSDELRMSNAEGDIVKLREALSNSAERKLKLDRRERVTNDVRETLLRYVNASEEDRAAILKSLGLDKGITLSKAVVADGTETEVQNITSWLGQVNLHFGDSATGLLYEMLGGKVSLEDLSRELILVSVLSGTLNPTTEGELMLSMFALDRVAKLHGLDTKAQRVDFSVILSEAKDLPFIAHINGDHFVLVKSIADGKVVMFDKSIGEYGAEITMSVEEFKKAYSGVVLSPNAFLLSPELSESEARQVVGSGFWSTVLSWAGFAVAAVVTIINPAAGAALASIAGLVSVGSLAGQAVSQAFGWDQAASIFGSVSQVSGMMSLGSNLASGIMSATGGTLSNIGNALGNVGEKIWNGITSVARDPGGFLGNVIGTVASAAENVVSSITNGGILEGLKNIGSGLASGIGKTFSLIGAGITKGVEFIQNGVELFSGSIGNKTNLPSVTGSVPKVTFAKTLYDRLVITAVNQAAGKSLAGLNLPDPITRLAYAAASGGMSNPQNFVGGSLKNLLMQGVDETALKLSIPPPVSAIIHEVTGFLAAKTLNRPAEPAPTPLQTTGGQATVTVSPSVSTGSGDNLFQSLFAFNPEVGPGPINIPVPKEVPPTIPDVKPNPWGGLIKTVSGILPMLANVLMNPVVLSAVLGKIKDVLLPPQVNKPEKTGINNIWNAVFDNKNETPVEVRRINQANEEFLSKNVVEEFLNYPEEIIVSVPSKVEIVGQALVELIVPFADVLFSLDDKDYGGALFNASLGLLLLGTGKLGKVLESTEKFSKLTKHVELAEHVLNTIDKTLLTQEKIKAIQNIASGEVVSQVLFRIYRKEYEQYVPPMNIPPQDNGDGTITYYPGNVKNTPEFKNGNLYIPVGEPRAQLGPVILDSDLPQPVLTPYQWGIELDEAEVNQVALEVNKELWNLIEHNWEPQGGKYEDLIAEALETLAVRYKANEN